MLNIKSKYGVQKNWQGDPCGPKTYIWDGLNCSFNGEDGVRIISLYKLILMWIDGRDCLLYIRSYYDTISVSL
ncbi:hypothetical protein G4B88_021038 [Cannabis sativa]|uniref:Uncharacterized protein n=1 Tax=Cannabis sativa TaxID=3483 RepID=A0A7J6HWZ5_CANSA|nr:hypothetical protein G4B88_021038 [Cannabis sativa]